MFYLRCQSLEESFSEVQQIVGSIKLGIHIFNTNQFADRNDRSVTVEAVSWETKSANVKMSVMF